ncbi:methyltransferase domain-containing protein [Laspinema olomoucense]|uniref:methyltransferase domain-containing protein n=1 Tax=Laspinema olomoucense TaxID=3231600 RepID=UPI0021BB5B3E|nr:methyltransferase domain-containing protein [Laspinema sp. D3c]MCT7992573.1 methyltransferase domain-containing protein [Laspinema sp. D3c]
MKEQKKQKGLVLDQVFRENVGLLEHTFKVYNKIYNLQEIIHAEEVTEHLFKYIKTKKYFVLLAVYDNEGRVFLTFQVQDKIHWTLPGGSIRSHETVAETVIRISKRIHPAIAIGEIEPIASIENVFTYKGDTHTHLGLGFIARIRNYQSINKSVDIVGAFVNINEEEVSRISRPANKDMVVLCKDRFKTFKTEFPDLEISTNEQNGYRYNIHNKIVKKIILTPKIKKKEEFNGLILQKLATAQSIIDVSCGDCSFIYEIEKANPDLNYLVANDISWSQMELIKKKYKNIIFTNHNAVYLPFKDDSFDVAFCSNTLHHMQSRDDLLMLLDVIFRVGKRFIIVEIENPKITGLFPYLLNKYWYIGFLRDVGGAYLSQPEFQSVIEEHFDGKADINFSSFTNIQGRYMIADVVKR